MYRQTNLCWQCQDGRNALELLKKLVQAFCQDWWQITTEPVLIGHRLRSECNDPWKITSDAKRWHQVHCFILLLEYSQIMHTVHAYFIEMFSKFICRAAAWAHEVTLTIRGVKFRSFFVDGSIMGRSKWVRRAGPKWFTCQWLSNPSSDSR